MTGFTARLKSRTVLFAAGIVATLCLAGPMAGFASSLFWRRYPLGSNNHAAMRILYGEHWRRYDPGDLPTVPADMHLPGDCEIRVFHLADTGPNPRRARDLMQSIKSYQSFLQKNVDEDVAVQGLASLPAPLLGALEGCLGRSLLSPLCASYARARIAQAHEQSARDTLRNYAEIDKQIDAVWCAAAEGAPKLR